MLIDDTSIKAPAIRYHGAKFRLAKWVIAHMPEHQCYVESFGGAAGVLLQKPRSHGEVYNDLDGDVVNFFRVLRDPEQRSRLQELLTLTPYARDEFDLSWMPTLDPIEQARRLVIRAQMGFGSAGATKGSTGFRIDTKRPYATAQHEWARYPHRLSVIGERFTGVLIENRQAIEVMEAHDAPTTLHFVDPPYMFHTRRMQSGGRGCYRHEMTDADHVDLIDALHKLVGMVMLAGYDNQIYNELLPGWTKVSTQASISSRRGSGSKHEVMWMSPNIRAVQLDLLGGETTC